MNNINQHQISSLQDLIMPAQIFTSSDSLFGPTSHDDFLQQMLSSVPPSSAASFPWADDHAPPDHSTAVLASRLRQHQISNGAAKSLMLQQQQLLLAADGAFFPMANNIATSDHNDVVVDADSFNSVNTALPANDASVKTQFNGFTTTAGSVCQTSSQPQHFHHPQNLVEPAMNQGSAGGGGGGQPRQRVRARRGQATDPHSIAERLRRERIAERMKSLQELVPNGNKTDKASMLDEIIDYVKFLQLQVKVLSMSRLGGAGGVAASNEGRSGKGTQTASNMNEAGTTLTEQQVAKLMEEDMGSAMQYLQGKGLCLMPISLATAISSATTSHSRKPSFLNNNPLLISHTSPSISALTVQSAVIAAGEPTFKDSTSVSKP